MARGDDPTCRGTLPGYELLAMHDPSGRRGLWARYEEAAVELCAGREGDDAYVCFEVGEAVTAEKLQQLRDVLGYARWMADEAGIKMLCCDEDDSLGEN